MKIPAFQLFAAILCAFGTVVSAAAQNVIPAVVAPAPTIDGIISPGEWDMAETVLVPIGLAGGVGVAIMHDNSNLYLAYSGPLESGNQFPEVLLDVNHSETNGWEDDDWWFHVSATDCERQGAYGVYDSCLVVQSSWTAEPNFTAGAPMTDTVEVSIPFSKIGFDPAQGGILGIAFVVTNTATTFNMWPVASDRFAPGKWGDLDFGPPAGRQELPTLEARVWPNPASDQLYVECGMERLVATICDSRGCVVHSEQIASPGINRMPCGDLPSGAYWLLLRSSEGSESRTLFMKR